MIRLGDALELAAAADLASKRRRPARRLARGRLAAAALALAVVAPGAAVATTKLIGSGEVAAGLPAGTLSLAGTEPACTVVEQDVEYHCVLAKAPAPEVRDWQGTVEPTVDATRHVNGGCRSLAGDGTVWECYLGQAAVDQRIIGGGLLGEYAPTPGVG
ncbi:MAG TPA: hypothetical protein VFB42_13315 [Gaiellaceae bacterium]|nr:hypothetical protein [Gaiellaceae bacterium]